METDLTLIGMEKGKQYETVITTVNDKGIQNAAPIGVLCSGKNKILNRIFKGSHTLENIISQREFVVNITHDPEVFALSTLGNLPESYFNEDNTLKCADAYFKCEVTSLKEAVKQSDPIKKKDEAIVIKSKVKELVIRRPVTAFNRSLGCVIDALTNFSHFDLVDDEQKEYFLKRFRECNRVVKKIGYENDKKAMDEIKKELIKKGYEP